MTENQRRIRELLEEGVPAARISDKLGISNRTVYSYIRKHRLPRNAVPKPGGEKETLILRAVGLGYTNEEIGELYSMTPGLVQSVVQAAKEREATS